MRQGKQNSIKLGGLVLLILLVGSLLTMFWSSGVALAQHAGPVRTLPALVTPGDEFEVTVRFTSPDDGFFAIGLSDSVPAGWSVSGDKDWCVPPADFAKPVDPWSTGPAEYVWTGLPTQYEAGEQFTAVYGVRVPHDAAAGSYLFGGTVEYYIGAEGPYREEIAGHARIEVEVAPSTNGDVDGQAVNKLLVLSLWIALGVAMIAGAVVFVVRRRRA